MLQNGGMCLSRLHTAVTQKTVRISHVRPVEFFFLHSVFVLLNRHYSFDFVPLFRSTAVRCPFFVAAIVTKTFFILLFLECNVLCFRWVYVVRLIRVVFCFAIYTFANQCKISCLGVLIYARTDKKHNFYCTAESYSVYAIRNSTIVVIIIAVLTMLLFSCSKSLSHTHRDNHNI